MTAVDGAGEMSPLVYLRLMVGLTAQQKWGAERATIIDQMHERIFPL